MNSCIIDSIIAFSDSYSSALSERFFKNMAHSDEEEKAFALFRSQFSDFSQGYPENLPDLFPDSSQSPLPDCFFIPEAPADIFINYHHESMNRLIHSHNFFELIYVCKGNIIDWVDGTEILLGEGEICIHNPNARHQILAMDSKKDFVLNILLPYDIFRRSFFKMLIQNKELDHFFNNFMLSSDSCSNFMVFHNTTNRIDTIIELLTEEFLRGKNASRFVMESTLVVLFGELMRNIPADPFFQKLVSYISDHLAEPGYGEGLRIFRISQKLFSGSGKRTYRLYLPESGYGSPHTEGCQLSAFYRLFD